MSLAVPGVDKERVLQDLRRKLGDAIGLDGAVLDVVEEAIQFMSTDGKLGSVHRDRYIVQLEQKYYGSLVDKFEMTNDLSFLKNVPSGGTYTCALHAADGRTISDAVIANENVKISLLNMQHGTDVAHVRVTGAEGNATIKGVRDVRRLMQMVFQGQDRHAAAEYGITQTTFNNRVNINNFKSGTSKRSEVDFADRLQASNPDLFRRMRYLPDINKDACVEDMYYCDPENNRWRRCSNAAIAKTLAAAFGCIDGVTRDEVKFIQGNRGGRSVLQVVAQKVVDAQLLDRIDTNLDLFAVNNGVFDSASGQMVYRPLEMQDYVMRHAKWDYCPEQAGDKRAEVEEYLAEVLPVEEEREVVLRFFASLMSGRRREKKFLVLKSFGSSGKSAFLRLMEAFFGEYCSYSGTKFACQSSVSRDSHDEYIRGIRLLVGEELKPAMQLDEGKLNRVVGGEGVAITGRSFGSGDMFEFVWQAGLVLVFNERDCPKFDGGDAVFIRRMIVAPFRSKFVHSLTPGAEHEFVARDDITVRFASWMSSLADVLVERFLPNRQGMFATLPASMLDWKNDITGAANPIAD